MIEFLYWLFTVALPVIAPTLLIASIVLTALSVQLVFFDVHPAG